MRYRWVYINGEAIPADQFERDPQADHHVMPDIQPYQSMADGTMITSRSQHREHLKRNHLIEVGNEISAITPKPARIKGIRDDLVRQVQQAKEKHGSRKIELAINHALQHAHELQRRR